MRIGHFTMLGIASVAATLSMGGGARAAATPETERGGMCNVCTSSFAKGDCYDYVDHSNEAPPGKEEAALIPDAGTPFSLPGSQPKGGCTYPPCPSQSLKPGATVALKAKDPKQANEPRRKNKAEKKKDSESKLMCVACRAMCPETPRPTPKARATAPKRTTRPSPEAGPRK